MYPYYLLERLKTWSNLSACTETRVRSGISKANRQLLYDEWVENSIPSVDCRNGRQIVNIKENKYNSIYSDIEPRYSIEATRNQRGADVISCLRRVSTCTVERIQSKLLGKYNLDVSIGSIMNMKPFLLKNPTEKENMCLHKYCLNLCLLFNTLMEHSRNNGPSFDSISKLFMHTSSCEYHSNGYWKSECCLGKCSDCNSIERPQLPKMEATLSYYAFEATKHEYTRTERVSKKGTAFELYNCLWNQRSSYLYHQYQIENDKYVWPQILETTNKFGRIFWMDYSENISGTPKFEPEDARFAKKQLTLHCTVSYGEEKE